MQLAQYTVCLQRSWHLFLGLNTSLLKLENSDFLVNMMFSKILQLSVKIKLQTIHRLWWIWNIGKSGLFFTVAMTHKQQLKATNFATCSMNDCRKTFIYTGKCVSEALIFESVKPQCDERLFIESPPKCKFRTCCVQILFWMSKKKKQFLYTTCSKSVFWGGIQWTISCHIVG